MLFEKNKGFNALDMYIPHLPVHQKIKKHLPSLLFTVIFVYNLKWRLK